MRGRDRSPGITVEVHELPGRTPVILMEIPAFGSGSADDTVLLYGHLDKQPEMTGWRDDLGPWKPVVEGDRLYGRGGADDGYAAFASVLAIEAAQANGLSHTRCVVLIEASEESGSPDLPAYLAGPGRPHRHAEPGAVPRLGLPRLRAAVGHDIAARPGRRHAARRDPDRGRAQRRGQWRRAVVVPHLPRAARPRSRTASTAGCLLPELHVEVPPDRREQAQRTAAEFPIGGHFPFVDGAEPMVADPHRATARTNVVPGAQRHWRRRHPAGRVGRQRAASVHVTAAQHPHSADMRSRSCRWPRSTTALTERPAVRRARDVRQRSLRTRMECPAFADWLQSRTRRGIGVELRQATHARSARADRSLSWACSARCSPRLSSSSRVFSGPGANAHGPNEYLHIPTARKVTSCLAIVLDAHAKR